MMKKPGIESNNSENLSGKDLYYRIDFGVRRGAARALDKHKKEGRSVVVWENNKVVKIPPEEIQFDERLLHMSLEEFIKIYHKSK